jgi:phosphoribosyl 1,2-cyclic phosphodiesterase
MLIRFWGTRGSLPSPMTARTARAKLQDALRQSVGHDLSSDEKIDQFIDGQLDFATASTYGGNSSCVEIVGDGSEYVVCDVGSGAREFGNSVMAKFSPDNPATIHIFQSHPHWDHICGFPFFVPGYVPGNRIVIHGCHDTLEEAYRMQNSAPGFPVEFDMLGADIEFVKMEPGEECSVAGMTVKAFKQYHSGDSYGYRFEKDGKSVVYSTDGEHKFEFIDEKYPYIDFIRGADILIFDAMYSLADSISIKEDWGHSSNVVGVELAQRGGVKQLCLYHHDPNSDDKAISKILAETIRFEELSQEGSRVAVFAAYDGQEIEL